MADRTRCFAFEAKLEGTRNFSTLDRFINTNVRAIPCEGAVQHVD